MVDRLVEAVTVIQHTYSHFFSILQDILLLFIKSNMTEVTKYEDNDLIQAQQTVIIEMPSGNAKIIALKPDT